jgi:hypothetical protein
VSLLLLARTAYECVPDVAKISTAVGVSLVLHVLTVAGFLAFVGAPGVVGSFHPCSCWRFCCCYHPAVDCVFGIASFPADPGAHMLL